MPKQSGQTPQTIPRKVGSFTLLAEIPRGACASRLFVYNVDPAITLFYKTGCPENDTVSDTDYEDKLAPGEWRFWDDLSPGKVIFNASADPTGANLAWHASWESPS